MDQSDRMEGNQRLSPMDAMMLFFETSTGSPFICGVCHIEGHVTLDGLVRHVAARLDRLPLLRKRVVPARLALRRPTWEDDPHFDLAQHMRHVELAPPGSDLQLERLASDLCDERFDFDRPLWTACLVTGLADDRSAVIFKFHHCMSDGMGARNMASVLCDVQREARRQPPDHGPGPPGDPGLRHQGDRSAAHNALDPADDADHSSGHGIRSMLREWARAPSVRLPFNTRPSGHVHVTWTTFDLDEMQAIRRALGGTVNDLLLTIVAEAVEGLAVRNGIEVEGRTLRIHQAADARGLGHRKKLGNRVAFIPALVPLGLADIGATLRHVSAYSVRARAAGARERADAFIRFLLRTLPPPLLELALRLRFADVFRRMAQALGLPPTVNLYVTNISWPRITLLVGRNRIEGIKPFAPLLPGVGLTCTALSYGGDLQVGITADRHTMPNLKDFVALLDAAYEALGARARQEASDPTSRVGGSV